MRQTGHDQAMVKDMSAAGDDISSLLFKAPTASLSAASLPATPECPRTRRNSTDIPRASKFDFDQTGNWTDQILILDWFPAHCLPGVHCPSLYILREDFECIV